MCIMYSISLVLNVFPISSCHANIYDNKNKNQKLEKTHKLLVLTTSRI